MVHSLPVCVQMSHFYKSNSRLGEGNVVNQHRFGDVTSNLAPEVLALVIDLGSCHSFLTMHHFIALYKFKFWCMIAHKALSRVDNYAL